jgi:hypothetical protein
VTTRTCDPAVYALAEHILGDGHTRVDPELFEKHCMSLALALQQCAEDWLVTPDEDARK